MIPQAKLERVLDRYNAIEAQLASGHTSEFVKLSKEHSQLSPVVHAIRSYNDTRIALEGNESLLADPAIVRNRAKVESTVANAHAVLAVQEEHGSLDAFLWGLVGGAPTVNRWRLMSEIPAETPESHTLSKELKRRGFRFLGPTTCYAFMQSVGMVNDHTVDCFRYEELAP